MIICVPCLSCVVFVRYPHKHFLCYGTWHPCSCFLSSGCGPRTFHSYQVLSFHVKRCAFSTTRCPACRVCLVEAVFVGRQVDARAKAARIRRTSSLLSPRFPPLLSSSNPDLVLGLVSPRHSRKTRMPAASLVSANRALQDVFSFPHLWTVLMPLVRPRSRKHINALDTVFCHPPSTAPAPPCTPTVLRDDHGR